MPLNDAKLRLCAAQVLGNAADEMCTDTLNTGITVPGLEKLSPAWGLHGIVTTTFTGLAEGCFLSIIHSATDNLSAASVEHTKMFIPVASLVAGAHFFVPIGKGVPLLQYVGGTFDIVTNVATAGAMTCWFGPDSDLGDG